MDAGGFNFINEFWSQSRWAKPADNFAIFVTALLKLEDIRHGYEPDEFGWVYKIPK